jgi:hypothetical protein
MLKQKSQIGGYSTCCNGLIPVQCMIWNVFKGTVAEPCLLYSMTSCTICRKRNKYSEVLRSCPSIHLCCKTYNVPFMDYIFEHKTLHKCLVCGNETWHQR